MLYSNYKMLFKHRVRKITKSLPFAILLYGALIWFIVYIASPNPEEINHIKHIEQNQRSHGSNHFLEDSHDLRMPFGIKNDRKPTPMPKQASSVHMRNYVVNYIRDHYLIAHNPNAPTNLSQSEVVFRGQKTGWKEMDVGRIIAERLNGKKNGFFVDCSAMDGVWLSSTLHLEQELGWTGILIEPDPIPFAALEARNRRAWILNVCLSPQRRPLETEMRGHRNVIGTTYSRPNRRRFKVQCFQLDSLLKAVNQTKVDYLSLDEEGWELPVLKTIPFRELKIYLISVEVRSKNNKVEIQQFLNSVGYHRIAELNSAKEIGSHKDLYEFKLSKEVVAVQPTTFIN